MSPLNTTSTQAFSTFDTSNTSEKSATKANSAAKKYNDQLKERAERLIGSINTANERITIYESIPGINSDEEVDTSPDYDQVLTEAPQKYSKKYESRMNELDDEINTMLSEPSNDLQTQEKLSRLRAEMSNIRRANDFWNDRENFGEDLSNILINNPKVFDGRDQEKASFDKQISLLQDLQKDTDEILQGNLQEVAARDQLAQIEKQIEDTQNSLLFLASGGEDENLEEHVNLPQGQISTSKFFLTEYSVKMFELQNQMDSHLSDGIDDPENQLEIAGLRDELRTMMAARSFWNDQEEFGEQISQTLMNNPQIFEGQNQERDTFLQEMARLEALREQANETILSGITNPENRSNLHETEEEIENIQNHLLFLANGGKVEHLNRNIGLSQAFISRSNTNITKTVVSIADLTNNIGSAMNSSPGSPPNMEAMKLMAETRTKMTQMREMNKFWREQKEFHLELRNKIAKNQGIYNQSPELERAFLEALEKLNEIENRIADLFTSNSESAPTQKAKLMKDNEEIQSKLFQLTSQMTTNN